jgi:replicative DNA helicase
VSSRYSASSWSRDTARIVAVVVGGALIASDPPSVIAALNVTPRDFRDHLLGVTWKAITDITGMGCTPTIPLVAHELYRMDWLDRVGGEPRLVELSADAMAYLVAATSIGMRLHAGIVLEWSHKRQRLAALSDEAKTIYQSKAPPRARGGVPLP